MEKPCDRTCGFMHGCDKCGEATPQTIVARPPTHPPQAEGEQNGGGPREKVRPTRQDQVLPTPVKVDRLWDLLEGYDEGIRGRGMLHGKNRYQVSISHCANTSFRPTSARFQVARKILF